MKHLSVLLIFTTLLLCSCRNNDADLDIELPINSVFVPAEIEIDKNELNEEQREEIMKLVNHKHIVNDVSELPIDPIGQNEVFYNIDYSEYTLLIMYIFKSWSLDTYSSRFYRNTGDNTYNWVVRIGTSWPYDNDNETLQLARFAILVKKLPVDADVQMWHSISHI